MFSSLVVALIGAVAVRAAQPTTPAVLCVAGNCLQGFSNTNLGAKLSSPSIPTGTNIYLLPGEYSSTTSPQLLHMLLTTSSTLILPTAGFENSSSSLVLPLHVAMSPGIAVYPESLYSGSPAFAALPPPSANQSAVPLTAGSLALASNVWASITSGNTRIVLWESVPDISQLPAASNGPLSLFDLQSSSCSPPCSGAGVCSASGTCTCPPGFTGTACETCAPGFAGPTCKPCPAGCTKCDDGITGTGACLKSPAPDPLKTCNCLSGVCGTNGQCKCSDGWGPGDNGTACAKCLPGFFLTSGGDCRACKGGCTQCADGSGNCVACEDNLTLNTGDPTTCVRVPTRRADGTTCLPGSFASGATCSPCSPVCSECTGPSSNECLLCAKPNYYLNGKCVGVDSNGVCGTTTLIGNNNGVMCDSCGGKCTTCKFNGFSSTSNIVDVQCTGCQPGFVLASGKCVDSCPDGSFLSSDGLTCAPCDSTCATCVGSANFCSTCKGNLLASNGACVTSCPSTSFTAIGTCTACHPDCASCSGGAFNQCTACNPSRPVLASGRCMPTCSKTQYFDRTSGSCQSCDGSCSSCSGPGPTNCLACSSSTQVVKGGSCVNGNCEPTSNTVPGLGVCLSDLVLRPSSTSGLPPLPSITGLNQPTIVRRLAWWEILLMALGCAFIFLVILLLWRRRARKQRAKRTQMFAKEKGMDRTGWRWALVRFGERLFGHRRSAPPAASGTSVGLGAAPASEVDEFTLMQMRNAEEERHHAEMEKILGAYAYSRAGSSHHAPQHSMAEADRRSFGPSLFSAPSMYSQMTGIPRKTAEPRQPIPKDLMEVRSFTEEGGTIDSRSIYSQATSTAVGPQKIRRVTPPPMPSDAELYADAHGRKDPSIDSNWITELLNDSSSSSTNNPFRK